MGTKSVTLLFYLLLYSCEFSLLTILDNDIFYGREKNQQIILLALTREVFVGQCCINSIWFDQWLEILHSMDVSSYNLPRIGIIILRVFNMNRCRARSRRCSLFRSIRSLLFAVFMLGRCFSLAFSLRISSCCLNYDVLALYSIFFYPPLVIYVG